MDESVRIAMNDDGGRHTTVSFNIEDGTYLSISIDGKRVVSTSWEEVADLFRRMLDIWPTEESNPIVLLGNPAGEEG